MAQFATMLTLEGLTYLAVDGRPVSRLAESWHWGDNGFSLRIRLRPDVQFHDGTFLTSRLAADILREAVSRPGDLALYPSLGDISGIGTEGDLQLVLELSRPSAFIPEELSVLFEHRRRRVSSWHWENDELTLRLTLASGETFHDDTPLTAANVTAFILATLERSDDRTTYPALSDIARVTPDGELGVIIDLAQHSESLPDVLTSLLEPSQRYIGTGPYRIVRRDQSELVFESFEDFHLGAPSIKRVIVRPFDSFRTAWSSLLRGEVDMLSDVNPDAVEFIRNDDVQVVSFARGYQYLIAFNSGQAPFTSPAVRRALNLAVDRDLLIARVFRGYAEPATGPLWHKHWAYDKTIQPFGFDQTAARSMLDQAGVRVHAAPGSADRPPSRLRFTCLIPAGYPVLERLGLEIQKQLYDIAVDMQIEVLGVEEFGERILRGSFEAVLNEFSTGPTLGRPYVFWRSGKSSIGFNVFGYENDTAEQLFQTLSGSVNEAAVRSATPRLQRVLLEDPPALFLAWSQRLRVVRRDFVVAHEPGRDPLLTLWQWTADRRLGDAVGR